MGSYSIVLFSLLLISSVIIVSSFQSSFANEIIATGTGYEDSSILELKNNKGNTANIDTVRIWLSGENEFKSFKTEQGWIGKNTPQGVIVFTSQNEVKPGESVKFGIKTTEQNPIVNWKALDSSGEIINSATTAVIVSEKDSEMPNVNKSEPVGIKDESIFRFIPDDPSADSNFRVVGEKFIPGQSIEFYIGNNFERTIKIDKDGKIFFTSKTPKTQNNERVEFSLRDSSGSEKIISLRLPESENRDIAKIIKLSIGNTPKEVKRGDTVFLEGMATPSSTLTIISKHENGDISNIDTIKTKSNGKWDLEKLISPDSELGQLGIEVSDGKSKILRSVEVISSTSINVITEKTMYQAGDTVSFSGKALPNQNMSIILEDSLKTEIFSRSITVGNTGFVDFDIDISRDSVEGTYILQLFQGTEEGITIFGIGQEPEPILILKPTKLNFQKNEDTEIMIKATPNAQVSLILIDSADREIFSDSINLGPDGKELYLIDSESLSSGSYILNGQRGESTDDARFSIGFTTGSGTISVQTTRDNYKQGEQILILGKTSVQNVILDIIISNPSGEIIKKVETFSDKSGVFKIDNFRVPGDAEIGAWTIDAKSGSNFSKSVFEVMSNTDMISILLDKDTYINSETINIFGSGATGSTLSIKIFDLNGEKIDELNAIAKNDGEFQTMWTIPMDLVAGEYEIRVDDGKRNTSVKFNLT